MKGVVAEGGVRNMGILLRGHSQTLKLYFSPRCCRVRCDIVEDEKLKKSVLSSLNSIELHNDGLKSIQSVIHNVKIDIKINMIQTQSMSQKFV
jgi:hypothetical protein